MQKYRYLYVPLRDSPVLFLRLDQALQLERSAKDLKERLVIRYCLYNGFSPMEISRARIEHLDPVLCKLFMPRRHWKNNCYPDVDPETVRLQIIYSGARKKGPLIRAHHGGHLTRFGVWHIVKRAAQRTTIPDAERVCPLILKRTYARVFLKTPGNTVKELQESFDHIHLEATARYLRFTREDVARAKARMMRRVEHAKAEPLRQVS